MKIYIIEDTAQRAAEITRAKSLGANLALVSMEGGATAIHILSPEPITKLGVLGCAPMRSKFHRPTVFTAVNVQETRRLLQKSFSVELIS